MPAATSALGFSAFHALGYQFFDRFLDLATVEKLVQAIELLPTDQFADRRRRGVVFARRNLLDLDFIAELLQRSEMTQIVSDLASDAVAVRAILFDKTGAANWTVPWHQDRSIAVAQRADVPGFGPWSVKAGVVHVQPPVEILRRMFTLRIHLDPCGIENGPLRVIPGSHLRLLDARDIDDALRATSPVDCTTDVGGLVIMRPLILHSSHPAEVATHRRVIHIEFGPHTLSEPLRWAFRKSMDGNERNDARAPHSG